MSTSNETTSLEALRQFVKAYPVKSFRPLAYYDKHLDCIRIQVKDCSFKEVRLNGFFTIWYENHTLFKRSAGFSIKGIKHLFRSLHLPEKGPIVVAQVIDAMVKAYPEEDMMKRIEEIRKTFQDTLQLPVELPKNSVAA